MDCCSKSRPSQSSWILDLSDVESLEVAIVENIQRDDLNPIEEARGYKRLNEEFKYDHDSISSVKKQKSC